jgi:hypothetical protein
MIFVKNLPTFEGTLGIYERRYLRNNVVRVRVVAGSSFSVRDYSAFALRGLSIFPDTWRESDDVYGDDPLVWPLSLTLSHVMQHAEHCYRRAFRTTQLESASCFSDVYDFESTAYSSYTAVFSYL